METKATTFRIDPAAMAGLSKLSGILKQSRNRLANEAIKEYVAKRILEVEAELASTLEDLRAYRKGDPDFEQSIANFIDAELTVKDDPAEGSVFIEDGEAGPAGPVQTTLRKVLND